MITKFKMFENNTSRNESDYIGKFLVLTGGMTDDVTVRANILLCNRIESKADDMVFVSFDCFDIYKNNDISDPVGDLDTLTLQNLNKLEFLSPTEFYNNYTEECELLFNKIVNDYSDSEKLAYWQIEIIDNYNERLKTIPEFEYYYSAEKYNL